MSEVGYRKGEKVRGLEGERLVKKRQDDSVSGA
jgi:hypothetical protein